MGPHRLLFALAGMATLTGPAGCGDESGVGGIVSGPLGGARTGTGAGTTSRPPGGSTTTTGPGSSAPSTTAMVPPTGAPGSGPTAPATTAATSPLRLGGDDLGVTRVGAPFREAVAAVSAVLGRPTGDPAPDTSCIGAEEETSWGTFRLAASVGRVSGWISTSTTLATPAGVTVGTTVAAVRQAYGDRLVVRPPPEPDGFPVFVVTGANLGGTLTGDAPSATVTSVVNGTCQAA